MSDFYSFRTPKAAKPHQCEQCGKYIAVGETHSSFSGRVEGEFATYREHLDCREAWQALWHEAGLSYGDQLDFLRDLDEPGDHAFVVGQFPSVAVRLGWAA